MPGKFDPQAVSWLYLRVVGGEVGAASTLAPKVGPLGLSPKKLGEDIAKGTQDWKGQRVTCKIRVQNRQWTISVVPSAAALLIKELKEPLRDRKKVKDIKHDGNLTFDQVVKVAKDMAPRSMAKHFRGTVKSILGTASSLGCTVDGKDPKVVTQEVEDGLYEIEDYEAPPQEAQEDE
eukprot:TRINITY_DN18659_c0_g1_i1.p1 TRINITY_DN18659_c0_g1~~TRINITY_DN18659_c0_g1_i1.p1  ORF type:complete len:187 (+),score=49.88 TRINITY_DN18659_c0_g1_i1:31-561(+)